MHDDDPIHITGAVQRACRDCHRLFVISETEVRWFAARSMSLPRRCEFCQRQVRRLREYRAGRDS
jgi:hypothetical protein